MNQIHLINTILNWERRLEIENEKRKAQRSEPYREHQTDFKPYVEKRKAFLSWISKLGKNRRSDNHRYSQVPCQEIKQG